MSQNIFWNRRAHVTSRQPKTNNFCIRNQCPQQSMQVHTLEHEWTEKVTQREQRAVADLEGGRAGSAPPLWRRTDAVTVLLKWQRYTVLWRHALQNIQNDCHHAVAFSQLFIRTKICFRWSPRSRWGNFTALPKTLYSWFNLIFSQL